MMTGESKIKGGKHKGSVKLFPLAKGGNIPGEDGPYRPAPKEETPAYPPRKFVKKKKGHDVDGKDISWTA